MNPRRWLYLLGLGGLLAATGCAHGPQAFVGPPLAGEWNVAILPLTNLTKDPDASNRLAPMLAVELARRPHVHVVDAGKVDDALSREPWILLDRIPPDLVDAFGKSMGANALLVGSVMAFGYREEGGERIPQVSISLRLVETPGGRVLWSAVHNRDGADRESVFGLGRQPNLEKLAEETVREVLRTLPGSGGEAAPGDVSPAEK